MKFQPVTIAVGVFLVASLNAIDKFNREFSHLKLQKKCE